MAYQILGASHKFGYTFNGELTSRQLIKYFWHFSAGNNIAVGHKAKLTWRIVWKDALNWSKVLKTYIIRKVQINAVELSIDQSIKQHNFLILIRTLILIRNVIWAPNQHIRMFLLEGSRDMLLKTWIMVAENQLCHQNNKLHFKIYSNRKYLILNLIIVLYFLFYNITVFTVYLIK